jgi:CheY-like chemotaxis protein
VGSCALVVAADPADRKRYRRILQGSNCAVREAVNGVTAVMEVRAGAPDVILMAMQQPDVPGQQAVKWLWALPGGKKTPLTTLS